MSASLVSTKPTAVPSSATSNLDAGTFPYPSFDPACPREENFKGEFSLELTSREKIDIRDYQAKLTLMEKTGNGGSGELHCEVYILNSAASRWTKSSTDDTYSVRVHVRADIIGGDASSSDQYWKFTADPDPKYEHMVIRSSKLTNLGNVN